MLHIICGAAYQNKKKQQGLALETTAKGNLKSWNETDVGKGHKQAHEYITNIYIYIKQQEK
jgi:hypothetical protein